MSDLATLRVSGCLILLLFCTGLPAMAEPPRDVEVVGHFGTFRFADDESWGGSTLGYGFTATFPLTRRWALETDLVHGTDEETAADTAGLRERRMVASFHAVYRRGDEGFYWFVGGGYGFQNANSRVRTALPGPPDSVIGIREFRSSESDFSPSGHKDLRKS
ncbi:MAG: hypothetical protein U5J83_17795 [Bryobacterales bacterium]|nr:hypothetical protein [Bryobacterales bacterium]